MPTIEDMIDDTRGDLSLDASQVSNVVCLRYFNWSLHYCENAIVNFLKDNFLKESNGLINTVALQNNYYFPNGDRDGNSELATPMMKKLISFSIKYSSTGLYYPATVKDPSSFTSDLSRYENNQPKESPFIIISGPLSISSFVVYPTPITSVTGGIKIDYEFSMHDMALDTPENEIPFDWQRMYVVQYGLEYKITRRRKGAGSPEEVASYERFKNEISVMLSNLSDRLIRTGLVGDPTASIMGLIY